MKRLFVAHKSLILSLLFIFLFSVTVSFASPLYNSQNTTLNPQCAPTDPDCTVQQSSWDTVNGSISSTGNVSVGTSTVDLNNKLNVVGGALFDNATVTTSLVIPQMPTVANQAASKGYVDSSLDGVKTFPQTTEAPIMSNPPVVTFGDSSAPTTISGGTLVPMTNSAFRYSGADVVQGNSYPNDLFYGATGLNSTYGVLPFQVEFTFTGTEFEIFQKSGGEYRLVVDGERVTERYQSGGPNDGSLRYRKIVFSSRKTRHIRLEMSYMAFGGIVIHPSDTIAPPTTPKGKRAIFLGDSFTEPADGYANTTSRMLGWEGWESGSGGTGYVNPGIAPGRVNFTNRVQTDVIDHNPDVVVIAGGINDGNDAQLQTNAEYVFSQIRSQLPNTKLIVVGPWWPTGTPNSDILAARDKIQTAAAAYGAVFIDPIAEHWITGQRTDCSTGNACLYTSDDNTHPTQVGHDYLGMRLAQKILQLAPETTSVSTALSAGSLSSAGGTLSGRLSLSSKAGTDTLLTNRLVVNTPGTADTLAETLFTVSANTHKALVLQGTTSQSANLQEWQNVSGTVMASLSGAGNLALGVSTITPDSAKLIVKGDAGKTAAKFQTSDSSGSVVQFLQASGNYVIGDIYAENGGGRLTINSESGGSGVQLGASYDTPFLNIIRSSTSGRSNFINFKTRNSSDWYIGSDFNDDTLFRFRRNSTDFAVISDVGNLGIGTTTPTSKLFVQNTDGSLPGLTIKAASG